MKYFKLPLLIVMFVVLFNGAAFAHDKRLHKGKSMEGRIVSITPEGFELATDAKQYLVLINAETKFEIGDKAADKEQLTKDAKVKVFGTKLPGGKIAAKEVLIEESHMEGEQKHSESEHSEEHHE